MRIALVVDRFDGLFGGLERWTVQLAGYLLGRGHKVEVLTFAAANHDLDVTLNLLDFHSSAIARAQVIASSIGALRKRIDVVHDSGSGWSADVFHPQTGSHLGSLDREIASHSRLRRLKASVSPRTQLRRWQMARLESLQAVKAGRIIAVSKKIALDIQARHAVAPERITMIPNGADTKRFGHGRIAPARGATRARLGLAGAVAFLCAAHNMRLKGVDNAMRALAILRAQGADVMLVVAGGAPDRHWHELARVLGIACRIRFLGPVDDMAPIFAAADAYVHPTRWDACSLSTIEAAAAGLPVVTTTMNGAAELIEHGRTGFVLPNPEDVAELADCMRALLDPGLRRMVGDAAAIASGAHDIRINLLAVEQVLLDVAASRLSDRPLAAVRAEARGSAAG